MLRFYLDEHVAKAIAVGLRSRNIDVKSTIEAGLAATTDQQQLEFARLESRVLFTNDADFLRLAVGGYEHCGIVYCHPSKSEVGHVIRFLALMSDCLELDDLKNIVEYM